jgi:hypothetical protein
VLTYTTPAAPVTFGPLHAADFPPGAPPAVELSDFRLWFTEFTLHLGGYLGFELFGYGTKSGTFTIAELNLQDLTGDLALGLHPGLAGTVHAGIVAAHANRRPLCAAAAPSIPDLWPVDHRFVPVTVAGLADPDADPLTVAVTAITQDEPVDTLGSPTYGPDAYGVDTPTAHLRAESAPGGNGRVYHLAFTAADGQGSACIGSIEVGVPAAAATPPIDDGPHYNATVATLKPLFVPHILK